MPVETELRDEGHVNYFRISDPWTLDDLFGGFAQAQQARDAIYQQKGPRQVHTLVDLMGVREVPPGVLQGRRFPSRTHATRGAIVVAVANSYARNIAETILRTTQTQGVFFESLDEAWAYIRQLINAESADSALPDSGNIEESTSSPDASSFSSINVENT